MSANDHLEYKVNLLWDGKSGGTIPFEKYPALKLDTPIEFGGEGRYPCPDELFISAVGGCLLTTFLYFRRKFDFPLEKLQISINGTVDSIPREGYRLTSIEAKLHITTNKNEEATAKKCAEYTKTFCHITRVLEQAIPIEMTVDVTSTGS
jgi:organic hydroperoxide reductase OsmC/OhrA